MHAFYRYVLQHCANFVFDGISRSMSARGSKSPRFTRSPRTTPRQRQGEAVNRTAQTMDNFVRDLRRQISDIQADIRADERGVSDLKGQLSILSADREKLVKSIEKKYTFFSLCFYSCTILLTLVVAQAISTRFHGFGL